MEDAFPADHLRRISNDHGAPILWTVEEVNLAITHHFDLARTPDVDESVADLWDAAYHVRIVAMIWEGWLVDWRAYLDCPDCIAPNPDVPSCLVDHCAEAVSLLVNGGVLRTRYAEDSAAEILERFPPAELDLPHWEDSRDYFSFYCSRLLELTPLSEELIRVQLHLEESPESDLPFHIIQLGTRNDSHYPGTFLDLHVGYEHDSDFELIVTFDPTSDWRLAKELLVAFAQLLASFEDDPYWSSNDADKHTYDWLREAVRKAAEATTGDFDSAYFCQRGAVADWVDLSHIANAFVRWNENDHITARILAGTFGEWNRARAIDSEKAPGTKKPKRSTARGEGKVKLIAALTKHHQYADGSCLNLEPIGSNQLAQMAEVADSTASDFFRKQFGGHSSYRAQCHEKSKIVGALKLLNQEFTPHGLSRSAREDRDQE